MTKTRHLTLPLFLNVPGKSNCRKGMFVSAWTGVCIFISLWQVFFDATLWLGKYWKVLFVFFFASTMTPFSEISLCMMILLNFLGGSLICLLLGILVVLETPMAVASLWTAECPQTHSQFYLFVCFPIPLIAAAGLQLELGKWFEHH